MKQNPKHKRFDPRPMYGLRYLHTLKSVNTGQKKDYINRIKPTTAQGYGVQHFIAHVKFNIVLFYFKYLER